jgi:hypothetical protein
MNKKDIDLKEYVDKMVIHEREMREQMIKEIDSRLHSMNELRTQINEERGSFITREIHNKNSELLETRIRTIELFDANLQGKIWMLLLLTGGITTVITLIVNFLLILVKK